MRYLKRFNESNIEYKGNLEKVHKILDSHGFEDIESFNNLDNLIMRLSLSNYNCDAQMDVENGLSLSLQSKRGREFDYFSIRSFSDENIKSLEDWISKIR